jgi:hypothetical protein
MIALRALTLISNLFSHKINSDTFSSYNSYPSAIYPIKGVKLTIFINPLVVTAISTLNFPTYSVYIPPTLASNN